MSGLRFLVLVVLGIFIAGMLLPVFSLLGNQGPRMFPGYTLMPAPWLIPKKAGGSALRLAMIHDVLHERFYVHGPLWFQHRHAQVEKELANYDDGMKRKDARYFSLLDDFAVDFDRLGRPAEGIPVLRKKLDLQQPLDSTGKRPAPEAAFYTTYANLGTLLAHANLKGAIAKDPTAMAGLREGLSFIEQSMQVNPDAHFGRETWQAIVLHYLLYAIEHPETLTSEDLAGIKWSAVPPIFHSARSLNKEQQKALLDPQRYKELISAKRTTEDETFAENIRRSIPIIYTGMFSWRDDDHTVLPPADLVPFDEPALALVGIWTIGSGANPHFSLAFAHLMEGKNQPSIAWNAYERTCEMAAKFWPDAAIQNTLMAHCRARQAVLEKALGDDPARLRELHQKELAFGLAEQKAYQAYEAEHLGKGEDPNAPGFYAAFFRDRQPIASDPGTSDTVTIVQEFGTLDLVLLVQALVFAVATLVMTNRFLKRRKELAA
jgi:hypothetical protein